LEGDICAIKVFLLVNIEKKTDEGMKIDGGNCWN
jgi:hypothetical protein